MLGKITRVETTKQDGSRRSELLLTIAVPIDGVIELEGRQVVVAPVRKEGSHEPAGYLCHDAEGRQWVTSRQPQPGSVVAEGKEGYGYEPLYTAGELQAMKGAGR